MATNRMVARLALSATLLLTPAAVAADPLRVAVAANLQPSFQPLLDAFHRAHPAEITPIYGSSGKLFAQIVHGAPFHLFLSADRDYPERLHAEGHTLAPPGIYALGALVVWWNRPRPPSDWRERLTDGEIHRVALAHPETAPYGREAMRLLKYVGLEQVVAPKLVQGESVAQTNQFLITGAAQMGFTAKSSALTPEMTLRGSWVEAPTEGYAPIQQAVVMLRYAGTHETETTRAFYDFLFTPAAGEIFRQGGYALP